MREVERTDDSRMKILMSFSESYKELLLLEKNIQNKNVLTIRQYTEYLSKVALCIELGMKSIILNENNVPAIHNLKELYTKMPKPFKEMFEVKNDYQESMIETYLQNIKNIFVDFRYMDINVLEYFLDENTFNEDKNIIFSKSLESKYLQFMLLLLNELVEFCKFLEKHIEKTVFNKNLQDHVSSETYDEIIGSIFEQMENIQKSSYIERINN